MATQQRQVTKFEDDIELSVSNEMKEMQLQEKLKKLDQRQQSIIDKYLEFEQYGKDDYRAVMMRSILEVSVVMKDMINTLMGAKEAFQYLFEAMDIVDDTFNIFQDGLLNSTKVNYGFFARLKQRRQMNKAITNNVNRMKQMSNMIVGMTTMSSSMVSALQKATTKMSKTMSKGKKNIAGSSSVDKLIEQARQNRGYDSPAPTQTTTTTTTSSNNTPTSTDSGVDDL